MKAAWLLIGYIIAITLGISMVDASIIKAITIFQSIGQFVTFVIGIIIVCIGVMFLANLLTAKPDKQIDWHK